MWAEAAGAAAATADPAAAATALARFHRAGLHAGMLLGAHAAGQSAITSRQLAGFVAAGAVSYYAGAAPRATGHVRLEVAAALRARADAEPIVAAHASCLALLEQAAQVPAPHAPQACHALARRLAWLSAGQPAAPRTLPADAVIALVRAPASSAYVWALLGPRLVG